MKNINSVIFAIASTGFLSLLSFSANADSLTPIALKTIVQINVEKQLDAERKKYTRIVSLAGSRQDELTARRDEAASTYKNLNDLKSAVVKKHYPTYQDYRAFEIAAKAYWNANKAFVDLQKSILSQNGVPLDKLATRIIAMQ